MKNSKWEKPEFKGLTLVGPWRDCNAMTIAQERGTVVIEEAYLCQEVGCLPETVEEFLAAHFIEHDIHAVAEGKEGVAERTLSVVRVLPGPGENFQVRLFSQNDRADSKWLEKFRQDAAAPALSTARPKRWSKAELGKVGVIIFSQSHLQCARCEQVWSPNIQPGGRLPLDYWKCPNGCNSTGGGGGQVREPAGPGQGAKTQ